MSDSTFLLDLGALRAQFSAITYDRGKSLYLGQRVLECSLAPLPDEPQTWQIDGLVQGTQRLPYEVSVEVSTDGAGSIIRLDGDCSCPVGVDCKHALALTLKAVYKYGRTTSAPASVPPAAAPAAVDTLQLRVRQWLDRFDGPAPPGAAPRDEAAEQVVYLLQERVQRGRPTVLELTWRLSRRLKKGGWSKPRVPGYDALLRLSMRSPDAVTAADNECVRLIQGLGAGVYGYGQADSVALQGASGCWLLERCAATGRLFLGDGLGAVTSPVALTWGAPRAVDWQWQRLTDRAQAEPLWQLTAVLRAAPLPSEGAEGAEAAEAAAAPKAEAARVFAGPPALYVDPAHHCCGPVAVPDGEDAHQLSLLLQAPPLPASSFAAQDKRLLLRLAHVDLPPGMVAPEHWPRCAPVAHLSLAPLPPAERARHGLLVAVLQHDYGGLQGWWQGSAATVLVTHREGPDKREWLLDRDLAAEAQAKVHLATLGLQGGELGWYFHPQDTAWLDWAAQDWAPLREAGFVLDLAPELDALVQVVEQIDVRMAQQDAEDDGGSATNTVPSWFDLSLGIEIDGQRQNILPWLPEWLAQIEPGEAGPHLPEWLWREQADGRWLRLSSKLLQPWLSALLELVSERPARELEHDSLRLSRYEALQLGATLGEGAQWSGAQALRGMLSQLAGAGSLPEVAAPAALRAVLRPYQQHGLNWLQFLRRHQLGGVLADDMGLGKTLQTLAHLLVEKEAGRMDVPCLIVVPVSLLGNWRREAERFAPRLRCRVWHGAGRHDGTFADDCDLLIAPYSLLQRDRERWLGQRWHVVVLDEAQHVKNASTHAAQVVAQLDARQRLALTGTPMENHLGELWSLFHFLMPGFLGSQKRFGTLFRTPIEKEGDPQALAQLRRRVTPFLLRRTKALVATELPALIESVTPVTLEGAQADLYETIRLATEKAVRDALADKGLARSQIQVLDALLKLRQVCCDPRLVKSSAAARVKHSAKLDLLMELLPALLSDGRRVLLFSQFTSMLTLIEERLKKAGLSWTKLTGQTQKRDAVIARFTGGEVPLFLISLKAGGTGLNLPQADTVIHYDPWWNPAVEAQATGRAHRIGQTQQVMVYKLVAEGTIEERILALQERKAQLAQGVLSGAAGRRQPLFTENDVAELLRPLGS